MAGVLTTPILRLVDVLGISKISQIYSPVCSKLYTFELN